MKKSTKNLLDWLRQEERKRGDWVRTVGRLAQDAQETARKEWTRYTDALADLAEIEGLIELKERELNLLPSQQAEKGSNPLSVNTITKEELTGVKI